MQKRRYLRADTAPARVGVLAAAWDKLHRFQWVKYASPKARRLSQASPQERLPITILRLRCRSVRDSIHIVIMEV
jgi:hypothetical protein